MPCIKPNKIIAVLIDRSLISIVSRRVTATSAIISDTELMVWYMIHNSGVYIKLMWVTRSGRTELHSMVTVIVPSLKPPTAWMLGATDR